MKKLSFNIALGGIISALCILLMFLVGVLPFFVYAFPMLCSLLVCIVYYECGLKTSLVTYISVSVLSLILSPDKESVIIFAAFFGYYPIAKIYIDRLSSKLVRIILKLAIFNASVVAAYYALISIFGVVDMTEMSGDFGKYGAVVLLALGNFTLIVYDIAIKRLSNKYLSSWRKHLFKRGK